jgi:hypothetical protein
MPSMIRPYGVCLTRIHMTRVMWHPEVLHRPGVTLDDPLLGAVAYIANDPPPLQLAGRVVSS